MFPGEIPRQYLGDIEEIDPATFIETLGHRGRKRHTLSCQTLLLPRPITDKMPGGWPTFQIGSETDEDRTHQLGQARVIGQDTRAVERENTCRQVRHGRGQCCYLVVQQETHDGFEITHSTQR